MAVGEFLAQQFCMLMTGRGKIKRVAMEEFASVRPSGLIAMNLGRGRHPRLGSPDLRQG
jgi:DNA gyrase/topoisomerase IV subunit A